MRKTLEGWKKGFVIGGKRISNLRYADDTVLLTTSVDDMKALLHRLEIESKELGLAVNKQKTKLMVVDRAGKLTDAHECIQGIDKVDNFIYLGAQINSDGSSVPEIKRRIAMAKDAMTRLQVIWKNRSLGFRTKMRLVRALVFPIFMYGVETWTILARERHRIDAFEMWCWRRMLGIPWTAKRTNVSILTQLNVKTRLSTTCLHRVLSYFGHIMRRGDESLEKLVVVGGIEGKRARGRSPTRWSDQVRVATSSSKFHQAVRSTMDRDRWRQIVKAAGDHDPQL